MDMIFEILSTQTQHIQDFQGRFCNRYEIQICQK